MILVGISLAANAQVLLYQWAFTNLTDTLTNSIASYSYTPGTGNLILANVSGNVYGSIGADGLNPLSYFTNSNTGPGSGPGVDATGAWVANGQGYSGGNTAIAIATNLDLGTQFQFTVTFWVKMGSTVAAQFPRFVQFYQTPAYDVGGKGSGNHNGVGTSVNDWNGANAIQEQNGIANNSSGQQNLVTITNTPANNPAFPTGFTADGATWYFEAVTYDGTLTANNFITWIGTLNTNIQPFALTANYSSINFTTNATVMIGGNNVNVTPRSLSIGAIADVRIYSGILTSNMLDKIRQFKDPGVIPTNSFPASVITQPVSGNTFASGSRSFSVSAFGSPAIYSYLWRSNGVAVPGGTNATLTLTNVQLSANGASFICSVTNYVTSGGTIVGGTNSLPATITVLTPTPGSYAQAVFTNKPYSFWLINEPSNTLPVTVSDYANGNDGMAAAPTNMGFLGGPSSPGYPGFAATNTAIETIANGRASQLDMADPVNFPNTGMTICGWVNTPGIPNANGLAPGLIFDLISDTAGGFGLVFGTDNDMVNYQWGFAPASGFTSGISFNTNEWTFVALVISTNLTSSDINNSISSDTNATIYAGAHSIGLQSATDSTALNGDTIASGTSPSVLALGRTTVAASEHGGFYAANTGVFNGVAVFYSALSPQTITNLFLTGAGLYLSGTRDPNTAGNLLLIYPMGTLLGSTNLTGPYTVVPGASTPYSVPMTNKQSFYLLHN